MKTIIFILSFMIFTSSTALAKWYVMNENNRAIGVTDYEPSNEDLATRNEFAVESDANVELHMAEFFNGKIQERKLSQEEKNSIKEADEEQAEMAIIYHKMFRDAYKQAVNEGGTFKYMHKHVDDPEGEKQKVIKKNADFNKAKQKLLDLGLTQDEIESLK